jgi:hypothetical protein
VVTVEAHLFILAGYLAVWAFGAYLLVRRENRNLRHLCNVYRRELGEPPLFPDLRCDTCNPRPPAPLED